MDNLTSTIKVQIDSKDKELANTILSDLGLNINNYINMAIKQLINEKGIPFNISGPKPTKILKEALEEVEYMKSYPNEYKTFYSVKELMEDLNSDD